MKKLIETASEINRILESGIEILPNSPIHGKLRQALILDSVMPWLLCIESYTDNNVKLLTKGKKYKPLYKHNDLYAVLDDTGDMEVFSEVFFK